MAQIIRSDEVEMEGRFCLGQSRTGTQVMEESVTHEFGSIGQAEVVEVTDQYSVIQVRCTCGHVLLVRCEHNLMNE